MRFSIVSMVLAFGCGARSPITPASDAGHDASADSAAHVDAAPACASPVATAQCAGGFCVVPAGCFVMGSPASDPCRMTASANAETSHEVTLTHAFEISETEVTVGMFRALMGYDPSASSTCGDACPVDGVTWDEAAAYCNALSVAMGLETCYPCTGTGKDVDCSGPLAKPVYACDGYRLPTEAEWEYAYRAGTTTSSYAGAITQCTGTDPSADAVGWYAGNAAGSKHPGGQKQRNGFGLYDMAGNLSEWCHDAFVGDLGSKPISDPTGPYDPSSRVVRGGAFDEAPSNLRASSRVSSDRAYDLGRGLRCARRR